MSKARTLLNDFCEKDAFISRDADELPVKPSDEIRKGITWDFAFEWNVTPTIEEIKNLISRLDECILTTGARYTITTVDDPTTPPSPEASLILPTELDFPYVISYIKIYGPPILKGFEILEKIEKEKDYIVHSGMLSNDQGPQLGVYDYALVWKGLPKLSRIFKLIETLDKEFDKIGLIYTIDSRSYIDPEDSTF